MKWIDSLPLVVLILLSLTLGLAPFTPQPHLFEKTAMLFSGELIRPIDLFDLIMHGSPMVLLCMKIVRILVSSGRSS